MNRPIYYTQRFMVINLAGLQAPRLHTQKFSLNKEIVPPGYRAGKFEGYSTVFNALAAAHATGNIAVIYQETIDPSVVGTEHSTWFGAFHVFDTNVKPFAVTWAWPTGLGQGSTSTVRHIPASVRFVHLTKTATTSWSDYQTRFFQAMNMSGPQYSATAQTIYTSVLATTMLDVHADPEMASAILDYKERNLLARANAVNLDLENGIKDVATGHVRMMNQRGEDSGSRLDFCKPGDVASPIFKLSLTASAMKYHHPVSVLATLSHEGRHLINFHRARHLLEQWRELPSARKENFAKWVMTIAEVRESGVSSYDVLLARALCGDKQADNLIHVEPHVEEWLVTASYLPVHLLRKSAMPHAASTTMSAVESLEDISRKHFHRQGDQKWETVVKGRVGSRLRTVFRGLSIDRQRIVRAGVDGLLEDAAKEGLDSGFLSWLHEMWRQ